MKKHHYQQQHHHPHHPHRHIIIIVIIFIISIVFIMSINLNFSLGKAIQQGGVHIVPMNSNPTRALLMTLVNLQMVLINLQLVLINHFIVLINLQMFLISAFCFDFLMKLHCHFFFHHHCHDCHHLHHLHEQSCVSEGVNHHHHYYPHHHHHHLHHQSWVSEGVTASRSVLEGVQHIEQLLWSTSLSFTFISIIYLFVICHFMLEI